MSIRMGLLGVLCFGVLALVPATAAEKGDEGDAPVVEYGPDGLPKYKHPYSDGLYSTITAMNTFWVPENNELKKSRLKVPGFRQAVPIYTITQDKKAPLVVILMGVDGKVEGPWGDLYPYWFMKAGFNVLTFDSTFTPAYTDICGQGVVGNFDAEAEQMGAIIDAYLKSGEAKNVSRVGVLGISFGATHALNLAVKAKEGKLPFELSGCLALCPPVKMKTAALTVDRFYREDRWDTTMVELAKKFGPHVPVEAGQPVPFNDTEMRAAIGFVFRDGLTKIVDKNDAYYKLKLLPAKDAEENRDDHAQATNFMRYMEDFCFPYWQKKGTMQSVEDLWAHGDLTRLLPKLPDYASVVIAANDPFSSSEDIEAAKAADRRGLLTVHPTGGHLGFIAANWTLVKALRMFPHVDDDANVTRGAGSSGGAEK